MNVVFRVDASTAIGIGHLTRCLTLAESLRLRGVQSRFICRSHAGHLLPQVERAGFRVLALPAPERRETAGPGSHAAWLGVTQELDAEECAGVLAADRPDWIVVDHYALDARWEDKVRSETRCLMTVDDLADRNHACDLLLDQNFSARKNERYAGLVPASCRLLTGPRYALLRPEYAEYERGSNPRSGDVRRVLVFFGGSDADNLTAAALEALSEQTLSHLHVDVVVGINNTRCRQLQTQASNRPNTTLHGPLAHLAELMSRADLAIGAAGMTTWERMCLGVPSLVVSIAANQRPAAQALADAGLIQYLGDADEVGVADFAAAIERSISGAVDLAGQSLRSALVVDGLGALRVAECLDPTDSQQLILRGAQAEDTRLFFSWANDAEVRRQSLNTDEISWPVHERWFQEKIEAERSRMFVLEARSLPVGQVRFDMNDGEALINFSLDADYRGRHWGRRLVSLGMNRMAEEGMDVFRAAVKVSNPASAAVFLKLGFRESRNSGPTDLRLFRFDSGCGAPRELA